MRHGWRCAIAAIACTIGLAAGAQGASAAIFYGAESGTLGRIDLDGGDQIDTLVDTAPGTLGVAVTSTHVFWADPGSIGRARLDGSSANSGFVAAGGSPFGVAVDATHVYWSDAADGTIRRASISTGAIDAGWIVTGASAPHGVAVDATYVYWTNYNTGQIGRAPIADPGAWTFLPGASSAQYGIAVDATHIYYAGANAVRRANLDGSGAALFTGGPAQVLGVAIDAAHVYWVDSGTRALRRASLADGSGATTLATLPAGAWGVAVGPTAGRLTLGTATFPDTVVGQTSPSRTISVTNTGEADLTVDDVDLTGSGGQFGIDDETCDGITLSPGTSCAVEVAFHPTASGAKTATLEISSADADVPVTTRGLSATALALPEVSFGVAPAFPDQVAGTAGPDRTVTVTNAGGSPLTVSGVSIVGGDDGDFDLVSQTCTSGPVAASGTCEVVVRFAPATAGAKATTLRLASDDPGSPSDLGLSATALAGPAVTFGPAPAFPAQTVGTVGPDRTVTVTNGGDAPLTVTGMAVTGPDAGSFQLVSETCTAGLIAAGGVCEAILRFAPGTVGAKTAALRVASDAASSPDDLVLAATADAVPVAPAVAPVAPALTALTPAGGTAGTSVTIEGTRFGSTSRVLFGDADAASFEVLGFDRIVAVAPAGAPGSQVLVRVVGPGGTSNGLPFAYGAASDVPGPVAPPPAASSCVVPDVRGETRRAARDALRDAGCALGGVTRPKGARGSGLVVERQGERPGRVLAAGARVAVRLGRAP